MVLQYPVQRIMNSRHIRILDEYDSVLTAIRHMDENNISALPVKNDSGQYTGVLSKTDIASLRFLKLIQQTAPDKLPVKLLMNRTPPMYVMATQPIADAVALMHKHHIRRVFVSDAKHKICGIVSTTDIIKLLFLEQ